MILVLSLLTIDLELHSLGGFSAGGSSGMQQLVLPLILLLHM